MRATATRDLGDAGSGDASTDDGGTDAGSDAGADAGRADGGGASDAGADGGGGSDAGSDGGPADPCLTVQPAMSLGSTASELGPPAVAADASGQALLVWVDYEQSRVNALLRGPAGGTTVLSDLAGYALTPGVSPLSAAAAASSASGFVVVWVEQHNDAGTLRYRFRQVTLGSDGSPMGNTTFVPGLAIHYTDVEPRLMATGAELALAYLGRTSDALPQRRLVFRQLSSGSEWTIDNSTPSEVTWDGSAFARVDDTAGALSVVRYTIDGTAMTPIPFTAPSGATGSSRIAAATDGWFVSLGDTVFRVRADGTVPAATTSAGGLGALVSKGTEALALGRLTSGVPSAWRVASDGSVVAELPLDPGATAPHWNPDAAAWTGTAWVLGFVHAPTLDDEARWTWICH